MVKLAASPHILEALSRSHRPSQIEPIQESSQLSPLGIETTPIETTDIEPAQKDDSRLRDTPESAGISSSGCDGYCEGENEKLRLENSRLIVTVGQLRETMANYEKDMDHLRSENHRLRESAIVQKAPRDFDKRLSDIERAVTFGLTHTLSALQGIRSETSTTGSKENSPNSDMGSQSSPQNRLDLPEKRPERLAITAGSSKEPIYEKGPELEAAGSVNEGNFEENERKKDGLYRPSVDLGSAKEVKVKLEVSENSAIKNEPKRHKIRRERRIFEDSQDFDDITFFAKPAVKRRGEGVNARLSRALSKVRDTKSMNSDSGSHSAVIKQEPVVKSEFSPISVKRELNDENVHATVKQDPTKRRKALAPVGNTNVRSSKGSAKKADHKAFDFVEKAALLEQSRKSLNAKRGY